MKSLVITRLPFSPRSKFLEAAEMGSLMKMGRSIESAKTLLFLNKLAEAVKKLIQGVGRGIRGSEDCIELYICDSRFSKALDTGRNYQVFLRAIPSRFHPLINYQIGTKSELGAEIDEDEILLF